jgi:hypothetical protein
VFEKWFPHPGAVPGPSRVQREARLNRLEVSFGGVKPDYTFTQSIKGMPSFIVSRRSYFWPLPVPSPHP